MKTKIAIAILVVLVVVGALAGVKTLQIRKLIEDGKAYVQPPESVSSAVVHEEKWPTTLTAIGSVTAVQGVTVNPELPGIVSEIAFSSGAVVAKGDLLVRLDTSLEEAQLRALEAQEDLARINLGSRTHLAQPEHGLAIRAGYRRGHVETEQGQRRCGPHDN